VIATAIPAAIMDSMQQKKIDQLAHVVLKLKQRVDELESRQKIREKEITRDIHEHVKKLVNQIQSLEKELSDLKSKIKTPVD
jgi:Mg2+ and Co2+ transporter CorA